jgi:hypothetical protein
MLRTNWIATLFRRWWIECIIVVCAVVVLLELVNSGRLILQMLAVALIAFGIVVGIGVWAYFQIDADVSAKKKRAEQDRKLGEFVRETTAKRHHETSRTAVH